MVCGEKPNMDNLALETWVPREAHDQYLADRMSDYWVQFAKTGNPNTGEGPSWPRYDSSSREFLEFGEEIRSGSGVRTESCDLFDDWLNRRLEKVD